MNEHTDIEGVRKDLPEIVAKLATDGAQARPIVFGDGHPQAVLISAEQFLRVAEALEENRKAEGNKRKGRRAGEDTGQGGYRLVFRRTRIQGEPTLLIAAFGRRANSEVYETAERRIAERRKAQESRIRSAGAGAPQRPIPRTPNAGAPDTGRLASKPSPRVRRRPKM